MKATVKYDVLFYNGERGTVRETYDCPDFEDMGPQQVVINGEKISDEYNNTIENQIDEWVSDLDKRDLMNSRDIAIIFNWEIISAKKETTKNLIIKERKLTQSELVGLFVKMSPMSDELKTEFVAVYKELKPSIKNLKFDKQIDITFKGLNIGMKAASQAYKYINEFSKTMSDMKTEDYKSVSWGETVFNKKKMLDDAKEKTTKKLE